MDVNNDNSTMRNLLPFDGTVLYYGPAMTCKQADIYFADLLRNIAWQHDEVIMFGKKITTRRKTAWYGSRPFSYRYSGVTRLALPWTPELASLKSLTESLSGETYNSCLLNLYHNGSEGMAWHSDAEKELLRHGAIASLSFGADRKFAFRHRKTGTVVSVLLEKGSLLLMKGVTQDYWQHRLPPVKSIAAARINLTFRTITS